MMELYFCDKQIVETYQVTDTQEKFKLRYMAEGGSVLPMMADEIVDHIELDSDGNELKEVGCMTVEIAFANAEVGDIIRIEYLPYATEQIGEIGNFSASQMRMIFDDICIFPELRDEIQQKPHGCIIRNPIIKRSFFAILDGDAYQLQICTDKNGMAHCVIGCKYFWACEFNQ